MPKQRLQRKLFFLVLSGVWSALLIYGSAFSQENLRESPVVKAVQRISPAVVNISSESEIHKRVSPFSDFRMNPFFDQFFKDFFEPGFERKYKRTSLGSGVIIDGARGFILTNAHVVGNTGKIKVVLQDKREFEAKIMGADPDSDLAILRIDAKDPLPSVEMGNSDSILIGETVIAIGNPFGFSHTVTTGVISAINRNFRADDQEFHNFIQTDASINPGNSGGPLLNINGELIGINTAIYAKAQGIGFAIPINTAKRIVADLIRYGEVVEAWIGINPQPLDASLASYLKLPSAKGVLVKTIEDQSPATRAGVRSGDIILTLDGAPIDSVEDYHRAVKKVSAGKTLVLGVWRSGRTVEVPVKTTLFPAERAAELAYQLFGIRMADVAADNPAREGAAIIEIRPDSHLARIGAAPGDVIRQMDDITIKNLHDFEAAVIKYRNKSAAVVLLQRGSRGYYITVPLNHSW